MVELTVRDDELVLTPSGADKWEGLRSDVAVL